VSFSGQAMPIISRCAPINVLDTGLIAEISKLAARDKREGVIAPVTHCLSLRAIQLAE